MPDKLASRLESYFKHETDGSLRSIVKYEEGDFSTVYLRDDVADQYTSEEAARAIDDSRLESISAPVYQDLFSENHGELTCMVKCFENVIEMNFVLGDGVGTAVALDATAFSEAQNLVGEARNLIEAARGE